MDEQARRVNETTQGFAKAFTESVGAVSVRTVSTQQLNTELTQTFFVRAIDNLRSQAESNRITSRELAAQARRGQEAARILTRESVGAYMNFVGSAFSFYRRDGKVAEGSTAGAEESLLKEDIHSTIEESVKRGDGESREEPQEAEPALQQIEADAEELPIEEYDSLNVKQVTQKLSELSVEEIERLRDYEAENKNRRSLIEHFERRIGTIREDFGSSVGETKESLREDIRSIIKESVRRSQGEG